MKEMENIRTRKRWRKSRGGKEETEVGKGRRGRREKERRKRRNRGRNISNINRRPFFPWKEKEAVGETWGDRGWHDEGKQLRRRVRAQCNSHMD